jgi:hypothetical protein
MLVPFGKPFYVVFHGKEIGKWGDSVRSHKVSIRVSIHAPEGEKRRGHSSFLLLFSFEAGIDAWACGLAKNELKK